MTDHHSRLILISASAMAWSVAAADSIDREDQEPIPIPENEQQQITLSLLERYPDLASSPGVKAAYAPLEREGTMVVSNVIFYPHKENGGIKEAYQAICEWDGSNQRWICDSVRVRRYLQLVTQDFEVRLTGAISSEGAFALLEASQRDMHLILADVADVPDTAIIVAPHRNDDYRVTWGTPEGYGKVTMLAKLRTGGDPTNTNDWQATVLETAALWESETLVAPYGRGPHLFSITPFFENAGFGGYRIYPGADEEQFTSLGLKPGDLLTKIDGVTVSDHMPTAAGMFESLRSGTTIEVTIERGTKRAEMEFALNLAR